MLQFGMKIRGEGSFGRPIEDTPYRRSAIASCCERAKGVACLEGEVLLYAVDGREVVIFDFAELEEAKGVLVTMSSVI